MKLNRREFGKVAGLTVLPITDQSHIPVPACDPPKSNSAAGDKPDWLQAMSVLKLEPDDIIIVKSDQMLSKHAALRIHEELVAVFGEDHKIAILEGLELGVVRQSQCAREKLSGNSS